MQSTRSRGEGSEVFCSVELAVPSYQLESDGLGVCLLDEEMWLQTDPPHVLQGWLGWGLRLQ